MNLVFSQKSNILIDTLNKVFIITSVLVSLISIIMAIKYCSYGIDFEDESYALNWIANPWRYKVSFKQFGFVYHPIFLLLKKSIPALRIFNLIINLALTFTLSLLFIKKVILNRRLMEVNFEEKIYAVVFSLSLSTLILCFLKFPTPNYNTLAFQGLFVVGIGVLLLSRINITKSVIGLILIGVGGWLVFMGKPSSAFLLSLIIFAYFLISFYKLQLYMFSIPIFVSVALLIISAFIIDGSIQAFVFRISSGLGDAIKIQSGAHVEIFRLGKMGLNLQDKIIFWSITFATSLMIILSDSKNILSKIVFKVIILISLILGILFFLNVVCFWNETKYYLKIILIIPIFFGAIIGSIFLIVKNIIYMFNLFFNIHYIPLFFLFLIIPFIYAFGTTLNYFYVSSVLSIFWILASLMFLKFSQKIKTYNLDIFITPIIFAQIFMLFIASLGLKYPYRQKHPLMHNKSVVSINNSNLYVHSDVAMYINSIQKIALMNGFKPGDPMIDLTGYCPGTLYVMQANALGAPWLFGGIPGSVRFAIAKLDRVNIDKLMNAWVLIEPCGHRKLPDNLLERYGINLTRDFYIVGDVVSPFSMMRHLLLKPKRLFNLAASRESEKSAESQMEKVSLRSKNKNSFFLLFFVAIGIIASCYAFVFANKKIKYSW